ncbi:MAG: cupin domain-containing protein [Pseudomonadota bacterium]
MSKFTLASRPIHLGLGATADVQPSFEPEMSWYEGYMARHAGDGAEGRLVTASTFTEPWDSWEVHPEGAEVVLCTSGEITFHQETPDGARSEITVGPGEYIINAPGVWHTADVRGEATALFITAGKGTQHRPR